MLGFEDRHKPLASHARLRLGCGRSADFLACIGVERIAKGRLHPVEGAPIFNRLIYLSVRYETTKMESLIVVSMAILDAFQQAHADLLPTSELGEMKITAVRTIPVELPLDKPVSTAIHSMESVGCICVRVETDQALVGEGYLFTMNAARLRSFRDMVDGLAHSLIGKDPHFVTEIWSTIWLEINPIGHEGVTISALSALDTACWDLVGKAAERPLHHIFGACRHRIRTYASGGLWLSNPADTLAVEAMAFVDQGFRAVKIRVGHKDPKTDFERVKIVRNAVGPDIELLTDANQGLNPKNAIRLGRMLEGLGVTWLEEPVARHNLAGQADVRRSLDLNVVSGETEWTRFGILRTIEAQCADILMPDLQRIGGLTEMRRSSCLAEAFNLPVSTHLFTEHSLCFAGSAANCISVEHMPWFEHLFAERMEIEDGDILMPDRPGLGFTFDERALSRYALDM